MAANSDFVTTGDAARRLGVTIQHVNRLIESGELTRVARGLVERTSVERLLVARRGGRTRVWAEHTAWAAIALLSDVRPDWLGPVQASRLRATLGEVDDPADLVTRTRDRAIVRVYAGHPSAVRRLGQDLAITNTQALGLTASGDRLDGYLQADRLDGTVRFFGLRQDSSGTFVIRATDFDFDVVEDLAANSTVLAALDLATSLDPRARGLGERALVAALEGFRR